MDKKYFFGIQRFVADQTTGKKTPKMYWGKNGYNTVAECIDANKEFIAKHIGEKFTIGHFPIEEDNSLPE